MFGKLLERFGGAGVAEKKVENGELSEVERITLIAHVKDYLKTNEGDPHFEWTKDFTADEYLANMPLIKVADNWVQVDLPAEHGGISKRYVNLETGEITGKSPIQKPKIENTIIEASAEEDSIVRTLLSQVFYPDNERFVKSTFVKVFKDSSTGKFSITVDEDGDRPGHVRHFEVNSDLDKIKEITKD